ncbi:MAG: ATP-binding protein [Treponema sp.]|nr:ATP-binding protein [Treponema sp.]
MRDLVKIAKAPVRTIIIAYAVIQVLFYVVYYIDKLHYRLISSALLIIIVITFTSIKGLSRLHLSILIPLSIAAVELAAVSLFVDGNRLIYIFLMGCSLVSLLYVSVAGLFIMTFFTSAAVIFLLFVCNIRLLGSEFTLNYEFFNFIGMTFNFIVILMIGKYSVGILNRSEQTGLTFDKVLEESSSLIVIVNNQARVEYISKSFAKILDIEKQEYAINLPFADLFPDIELKYFFGELLERYGTINTTFEMKTGGKENGPPLLVRSFMLHSIPMGENVPRSDDSGINIARFFDCVEITPIIESKRTAEAATRSKSEFLAMMSHEIRTPLNAIIGISQIQLEDKNLPDKYAAAQEKILSSGSSLLGIINDILDMSKIETGKLDFNVMEYDMPSLINDTVQLNIVRIGSKPIKFMLEVDKKLPSKLFGDELRLKQILNNLLSNAIKYTEEGHVKLSVKHVEVERNFYLILSVEDTGQGMKSGDKEMLFTEYMRFNAEANRKTEGTGLGLNITQKLVEMMGGKIRAESEWGRGSIFTVTLRQLVMEYKPIGEDVTQKLCSFTFSSKRQNAKMQMSREPMPYGSVLIVDDVDTNLYVAEGLLKPYELNIETVNSGFETIEKIESGKSYDIIFMDHMMPQMDGIETTQKLRELGYTGVIVALTANALAGNEEMFAQKGFDGFIPKPIDTELLNTVLNKFIRDRYPEEAKKYLPELTAEDEKIEISSKMMQIFYRDAEKAAAALREMLPFVMKEDFNLKQFSTIVHSMKSALWNVGELNASVLASGLENAALRNDLDYIRANAGDFLKILEVLRDKFKIDSSRISDSQDITEDALFLKEQLKITIAACKEYNITASIKALEKLKEKKWKASTSAFIDEIYNLLDLNSDFETAVKICEEIINNN